MRCGSGSAGPPSCYLPRRPDRAGPLARLSGRLIADWDFARPRRREHPWLCVRFRKEDGTRSRGGAVGGNLIGMSLSVAGLGLLVRASPHAFRLVELAGAFYLIALGSFGFIRAGTHGGPGEQSKPAISPGAAFAGSIAVSASSPKSIVFVVAFVPQFVSPTAAYAAQSFVLMLTFASVVAAIDIAYAFLALPAARLLRLPSTKVWMRRAGGAVFLLTGFATLFVG